MSVKIGTSARCYDDTEQAREVRAPCAPDSQSAMRFVRGLRAALAVNHEAILFSATNLHRWSGVNVCSRCSAGNRV